MVDALQQTLRPARLRLGWSLDELAKAAGSIISKQMLSKYEQGQAVPSQEVLLALAAALRIPVADLVTMPRTEVRFVAFRKQSTLPRKEEDRIKAEVIVQMQARLQLAAAVGDPISSWRLRAMSAQRVEDAERHAVEVRAEWGLGLHAVADLTATLEAEGVEVFALDAHEKFSGISAWTAEGQPVVVVQRRESDGARQRMDLAHELGHLVLSPQSVLRTEKEQEDYAARFGGAFLFPESCVILELGVKRSRVTKAELERIKQRYGISMQAIIRRARDVGVLTQDGYDFWVKHFSRLGRKVETGPTVCVEQPARPLRQAGRAASEGIMLRTEAERLGGVRLPDGGSEPAAEAADPLEAQLAFLSMHPHERAEALLDESRVMAKHYANHPEEILPEFDDEP